MNLTQTVREMHDLRAKLKAHEEAAAAQSASIRREISVRAKIMETATEGLDPSKVGLAETVLRIRGSYARGGEDRASVIQDAIRQIATGQPARQTYSDLWVTYLGTKNYAHWQGQRCDGPYGTGPKHGWVVFAVEFTGTIRKRDTKELTPDEAEAAIYYLTNLQRV